MKIFKKLFGRNDKLKEVEILAHSVKSIIIYHEFCTAESHKLTDIEKQIAGFDITVDCLQKLNRIGFAKNKGCDSIFISKLNHYSNSKDYHDYYILTYPAYPFITVSTIKELCDKYGLDIVSANEYHGHISENNIKKICGFNLDGNDKNKCVDGRIDTEEIKNKYDSIIWRNFDNFWNDSETTKIVVNSDENKKCDITGEVFIVLYPVRGGYLILTEENNE